MFETFRNAWKNEDLRRRILFTIFIIVIYRIGSVFIPVPFLDGAVLQTILESNDGSILSYMDILSGGALANATVFALSITPIINAQIIMQLLTYALPPLERLSKEGETGRKRIQKITDIVGVGIALLQGFGYYVIMKNYGAVQYVGGSEGIFAMIVIIACFVAVFYVVFGAIRMPENPHKYWLFESLLAFFDSSLWCYYQGQEKNPASPQLS